MSFIRGKGDVRLVLFITVDCLRNDYFLRFARFATSFFSRSGNLFANVYTHGVGTLAAFPAILTSTYPLMFSAYPGVGSTRQSLAEVFRSLGFYTVGLVPNPYLSTYSGIIEDLIFILIICLLNLLKELLSMSNLGSL